MRRHDRIRRVLAGAALIFTILTATPLYAAFLYQIEILPVDQIAPLADTALLERYVDLLIDIEATRAFHDAAGFNPDEFRKYKNLLRYRYQLAQEIERRSLKLPTIGGCP